ncbi:hypothetical protein A2949_01935 [Candidatus Adlerbacteria bacterium RIFCSPLOWO2_01_FULL_54_21b]|uniref:CSD domain-containing protein n=1 Tax=Candidatus Adlerbacteria bacterium RIFCSPLOWO2_01_FULL_54_21b TaxID=1797245 RepID=A0A1F4XZ07_9BACT|nr:MAG: hypothetical protein A2949_01935 [Candidatus Adlerbacteria bacterium RIFCSPLOWO2_01_FULL_54_21b]
MSQETVVKSYYPNRGYGFLINPEGDGDILFRKCGRRNPSSDSTLNGDTPNKGQKVEILTLTQNKKGLRATQWRLL